MTGRSATLDGESRDPSAGIGEEVLAEVSSPCRDEDGAGPGQTNERGPADPATELGTEEVRGRLSSRQILEEALLGSSSTGSGGGTALSSEVCKRSC